MTLSATQNGIEIFSKRSYNLRGLLCLVCGFLLQLTLGGIFTFGNLTTYMTSYLRERVDVSVNYGLTMWIASTQSLFTGLSVSIGNCMANWIGPKWTAFIGSVLVSGSTALVYFALQRSFWSVLLLFGFVNGIGVGIAYVVPLICSMTWFPEKKGTVSGIVGGGFGIGALILINIQTSFVNPGNVSADENGYFSDKYVLNNTRTLFLLMGGLYGILQLISISGLAKSSKETGSDIPKNNINNVEKQTEAKHEKLKGSSDDLSLNSFQALKYREFWILFLTTVFNSLSIGFINTLWKAFGQTFIDDDRLLALIGSICSVFNLSGRVLWGYLADRYGYKISMIFMCGILAVFTGSLPLTVYGGSTMFAIWIWLIYLTLTGTFSTIPACVAEEFGMRHAGTIYGWIFMSGGFVALVPPAIGTWLLSEIGYTGIMLITAVFVVISIILTFVFQQGRIRKILAANMHIK